MTAEIWLNKLKLQVFEFIFTGQNPVFDLHRKKCQCVDVPMRVLCGSAIPSA